jgi:ElaB/YqjD/DUF883 family membrane-anchored ribosome-binding protein
MLPISTPESPVHPSWRLPANGAGGLAANQQDTNGGVMDQAKAQEQSRDNGPRESVAGSINRGKEAVSRMASDAGVDLDSLRRDLSDVKETVAKLVSRASDEATNSAREIASQVGATAKGLAERGANVASAATDQAKTTVTELEDIARRNPLATLAGAVVVGILIGMMQRRQ